MYEPVHIPRRLGRRGKFVALVVTVATLIAVVVIVVRTMPHPPSPEPLTLDELQLFIPDAAQTELVAAIVRARLARPNVTPGAAAASVCVAPKTPHRWDSGQRANAATIVQV